MNFSSNPMMPDFTNPLPMISPTKLFFNSNEKNIVAYAFNMAFGIVNQYHLKVRKTPLKDKPGYVPNVERDAKYYSNKYQKKELKIIAKTIYKNAVDRCNNPKSMSYVWYGGRRIKMNFANETEFYNYLKNNVGDKPEPFYFIDRIDNNGNYTKQNVRFTTPVNSGRNKSNSIMENHDRYLGGLLHKYFSITINQLYDIFREKKLINSQVLYGSFYQAISNNRSNV